MEKAGPGFFGESFEVFAGLFFSFGFGFADGRFNEVPGLPIIPLNLSLTTSTELTSPRSKA
jgi:hypothetical protein